ncbi:MAG TPA: threonine/serine dehydratase [Ardenticatenaceae bacterium]|nr:threonine/serine dehydratase [Ardenticatenaceae bacterium]
MLTINDILHAQHRIAPYLRPSPLVHSPALSERTGADVWLKLESRQPTGSFKVRGALNAASLLPDRTQPVVTASAGNHGLGVALATQMLGLQDVTIFVPESAPASKVRRLRRFPVRLRQAGQSYAAAHEAAVAFAEETQGFYLEAYDDPVVIAGQGTATLEVLTELPAVELLLVPVGGGGLIAGATVVTACLAPNVRVIGVQPSASPAALLSLERGEAIDPYDHEPTLADGLAGGFGRVPFAIAHDKIERILLADELSIRRAIFTLIDEEQLVVEASGAIAITPLLDGQLDVRGRTVVALLSGANVDSRVLRAILDEFAG